ARKAVECTSSPFSRFSRSADLQASAARRLRLASVRNGRLHDGIAMAGQPIVIYSAANTQQAYLLKGLLVEQGITASVINDTIQLAGGELPLGWTTAPRVIVAESDAVQARALAEQFDREATREFRDDDSTEAEPLMEWPEWPVCPRCGQ